MQLPLYFKGLMLFSHVGLLAVAKKQIPAGVRKLDYANRGKKRDVSATTVGFLH